MAGSTTARRGRDRRPAPPGPPPPARRRRLRLPRPGRPRVIALILVLAALTGGFGTWALYGSGWLRVENVSVRWQDGPRELTRDQILDAAGVRVGSPMASLDKDAVRDRLLDGLPRLASVDVVRAWPHGVSLKVTEREAEVLMPDGDRFTEVDGEGVAFGERAEADPDLPLLELDLADSASARRYGEDRVRRAAVSVVLALPGEVRRETRTVLATSYDAISLELADGTTVFWGSPERSRAKADALLAVRAAAPDATRFDVSAPTVPASSGG
ncbi:FtsQ-type POTRA domain-containing protein [Streptomyces sp. RFCAC02]|uniref:cell division protein FtsQ/DivIB n=1 Tax=Streptomyces sp. RFCAC02 TaxID=2499143 RepID=UPI00102281D8|nr:FtsQ-type POTRA domain-containing protein [Streptomyces sp. RFCAC02]